MLSTTIIAVFLAASTLLLVNGFKSSLVISKICKLKQTNINQNSIYNINNKINTQLRFSTKPSPLTGEDAAYFSLEQQKVSSWVVFSAGK